MLVTTQSIVLRSIKYGETSLISTHFTRKFGIQSYLINGVRAQSAKGKGGRAGLLQATMPLDITIYHKPQSKLQRLREFSPAFMFHSVLQNVIKNSIAVYSVELLHCLLPESAPFEELFDFAFTYFEALDQQSENAIGNYPLFFTLQCSRLLGYELIGSWSEQTPFLNLEEGGFSANAPNTGTLVTTSDTHALSMLMQVMDFSELKDVKMNGQMRLRLLEWFLDFLHKHTDHMRPLKSLAVLQTILKEE